jgi:predicted ATPase/DNA-binding winged helix-turn-helix (wHTH) protein
MRENVSESVADGAPVIFRFANCELDVARITLRRDGGEVKLEPQAFDVLCYLVEHRGEVVRKEQLLDDVWGDRFVSESALTTRIKSVRQALGDDGIRQGIIRTVHGRGYEFIATVEALERPAFGHGAPAPPPDPTLPAAMQTLIGRESLLERLAAALGERRLITLVGPGGVGKTSVGLELARRIAHRYPDGVKLVELVAVGDEDATLEAVATAIDVHFRRGSSIGDAIIETLRLRCSLIVLDNCEHLVEPVASLASRIVREAPAVSIVATSREPLGLPGEQVWSVDPLSTGGAGAGNFAEGGLGNAPAVALFVERATAADPGFELSEQNAGSVVEICRRLDGIPLAIELAAARARTIDPAEIAARLDERFGLLKASRRGGDPRHRTMEDAISWSYDLLAPEEQELFSALAVFAGPFDLASAESTCRSGDALDLLTRLVERSMVSVRRPAGGGTRYELLETLREYGRSRMSYERRAEVFGSHAVRFAGLARFVEEEIRTPGEAQAIEIADASFADLRAAQRFALETGDLDTAIGIIVSSREFAMRAMRYELFAWADAASRAEDVLEHPLAPLLTGVRAYGAWVRGEFELAVTLAHETRALENSLGVEPSGLAERVLGNMLSVMNDDRGALHASKRQVELAEASGVASRIVHACYMWAVGLCASGDLEGAADCIDRARGLAALTGSPTDLASVAVAEGFASHSDEHALSAFLRADEFARMAGNRWMGAFALTEACGFLVHLGDLPRGCAGLAETVDLWYRSGEWAQQWHTLSRCVIALHRIGRAELAMELIGAIDAHFMFGITPMSVTLRDVALAARNDLESGLGKDRAAELVAIGSSRPVDAVVHRVRNALLDRPFDD